MMNREIIQAIAGFMGRATLQAGEIETFQACQQALQEAFNAAVPVKPEEESKAIKSPS